MKHISNKEKVKAQKQHINYLKQRVRKLNNSNYNLHELMCYLTDENEKLIEWIQKIINDCGVMEIKENERFRIPIIRQEEIRPSIWNNQNTEIHTETIIIPEIRLMKSKMI